MTPHNFNGIQRQSEAFRKGQTEAEKELVRAFAQLRVAPLISQVICFECGKHFVLYDTTSYPECCPNPSCRKKYDNMGMYCLPDLILEHFGKKAVIFVNGSIHKKENRKWKDRYQILRLQEFGYKIFVLENQEMAPLKLMNLLAIASAYWQATADDLLYSQMIEKEKEIKGIGVSL